MGRGFSGKRVGNASELVNATLDIQCSDRMTRGPFA